MRKRKKIIKEIDHTLLYFEFLHYMGTGCGEAGAGTGQYTGFCGDATAGNGKTISCAMSEDDEKREKD